MASRIVAVVLFVGLASIAPAEVIRWEIKERGPYAGGQAIGDRGAYERWTGRIHFALNPDLEANRSIVDLPLAPRNPAGQVEFWTDFEMLVPVDRSKCNGGVFYEVNNRGNKTAPNMFDTNANEFLCRQGFVVLWTGWIAEVQPGAGRLRMHAPAAMYEGRPVRGIVRNEFVVDQPAKSAPLAHRPNLGSYRPAQTDWGQAVLTTRLRETDERRIIPRSEWQASISQVASDGSQGQLPTIELTLASGLQPGWIYEIVYEAEGSVIQGVGLAGIRDVISNLKYETGERNPLTGSGGQPLVTRALGFGTSQSGRCLRHFLWEGFNADEKGRKVFDGLISHVAGGGLGSFNHRFASPTRTNGQHHEHLFPADYFPFTYGLERDPFGGQEDGILRRSRQSNTVPKIFHSQSSSEYWHRSASLVHTDPLGQRDAEVPPEVRIYGFGGTQHGPGSGIAGKPSAGQLPNNPADYRPLMRGLLVALDAWVREGKEPPASVYPHISDGTLVGWMKSASGWPSIPGVPYPEVIQQPAHLYRGPDWEHQRIASVEPPEIKGKYVVKVPAAGPDGNERGTLNLPAIRVAVATYTSWNLRHESTGAASELLNLEGGYVPFARWKAERERTGDPRPSLEERYRDYDDYERQYMVAAEKLVSDRYLLKEELPRLKQLCEKFRPLFTTPK